MRLRRSLLFVNGNDFEMLKKGVDSNADAIVLELEDAIPYSKKNEARDCSFKALTSYDFRGKEKVVRINPYTSEHGREDVRVLLPAKPDALRLTKCESPEYILGLDKIVTDFEKQNGLPHNGIEFILTIESPLGIINAYELAKCTDRITAIGLGAGDLTCSMDIDRILEKDTLQLLYAKQKLVMDGKAAGVQVIDTTIISLDDMDNFVEYDTTFIKNLGFTGRSVSMLSHIDIINKCFTPSQHELMLAKKIIQAYENNMDTGKSDIFVDGHFVDPGIADRSKRMLKYASLIDSRKSI